jgi:hypothetical protein
MPLPPGHFPLGVKIIHEPGLMEVENVFFLKSPEAG